MGLLDMIGLSVTHDDVHKAVAPGEKVTVPVPVSLPSNPMEADPEALRPFEKIITDPPNHHVAFMQLLDEWREEAGGDMSTLYRLAFKAGKRDNLTPELLESDLATDLTNIKNLHDQLIAKADEALRQEVGAKRAIVAQLEQQIHDAEEALRQLRATRDQRAAEVGGVESKYDLAKRRISAAYTKISAKWTELRDNLKRYSPSAK